MRTPISVLVLALVPGLLAAPSDSLADPTPSAVPAPVALQSPAAGALQTPATGDSPGPAAGVQQRPTAGPAQDGVALPLDPALVALGLSGLYGDPRLHDLPGLDDPSTVSLWVLALGLEDRGDLPVALAVYQLVVRRIPDSAAAHWRIARLHWLIGDRVPNNESEDSPAFEQYQQAESWARAGLEIDGDCAECMLWLYAALGRITVAQGLLSGVKYARTMSSLLDDGIALKPTYRDSSHNSTLGNLYYARAIFNRMVPDWWWLGILVGVRGDKEQALEDIDLALTLNGNRIDYQVEKGAVLMCLGTTKKRNKRIEEGRAVLREAMTFERRLETDELDLLLASQMIQDPGSACGFTREGFIDVEGVAHEL